MRLPWIAIYWIWITGTWVFFILFFLLVYICNMCYSKNGIHENIKPWQVVERRDTQFDDSLYRGIWYSQGSLEWLLIGSDTLGWTTVAWLRNKRFKSPIAEGAIQVWEIKRASMAGGWGWQGELGSRWAGVWGSGQMKNNLCPDSSRKPLKDSCIEVTKSYSPFEKIILSAVWRLIAWGATVLQIG